VGRKHRRKRQFFYIYFAFLISLLFLGCATIKSLENRHTNYQHLQNCQKLLAKGNFKEALEENQRILDLFDEAPHKDEALFYMGLIYTHHRNPDKDYKKSGRYFERLIQRYPQSPLVEQAKIWANVLEAINDSKVRIDELSMSNEYLDQGRELLAVGNFKEALQENQRVLSLSEKAPHKDQALFNMGLIYAHYDNPEKDYKKSHMYFERLIQEYPQSPLVEQARIWLDIFNVIEREKQVDIEIEKRKKELKR